MNAEAVAATLNKLLFAEREATETLLGFKVEEGKEHLIVVLKAFNEVLRPTGRLVCSVHDDQTDALLRFGTVAASRVLPAEKRPPNLYDPVAFPDGASYADREVLYGNVHYTYSGQGSDLVLTGISSPPIEVIIGRRWKGSRYVQELAAFHKALVDRFVTHPEHLRR